MSGCKLMKCTDYKDGKCTYDFPVCKYRMAGEQEVDIDGMASALMNQKKQAFIKWLETYRSETPEDFSAIWLIDKMVSKAKEML